MSLLSDAMEDMVILDKTTSSDGYGGTITTYVEGAEFQGAVTFDASMEARFASKQGVTSLYTLTTSRTVMLDYHDVVKRKRDGKVFRITSDGDDKFTPQSAGLDMRQATAEEWVIPNGQRTGIT